MLGRTATEHAAHVLRRRDRQDELGLGGVSDIGGRPNRGWSLMPGRKSAFS
jgi:hypothetical protein